MKAPEKLYISPTSFEVGEAFTSILTSKSKGDIEYTRTDAFIEKACDAYCKMCKMPNCNGEDCKYIKDFRKYIKGE